MKIASNTAKLLRNVPLPDEIGTVHDNAVIVDLGSGTTRVGFSGDDAPRLSVPTVVAPGGADEGLLCFREAYARRDKSKLSRVVERGLVRDWEGFEALFNNLDGLLGLSTDANTPLLLTESALVPREQRDQMTQILFEQIKVPSLYFGMSPVMGLYSSGRTTGMTVELGHGTCHTAPVFEGLGLFHSILQLDFGGDDLTSWLGSHLALGGGGGGGAAPGHYQRDIWQFLKETHCTVAPNSGAYARAVAESGPRGEIAHTLPDGSVVKIGAERHKVCESLFDPQVIGANGRGIHQLAADSIRRCDQDITGLLCGNVVVTGAGSLFGGLPDRLNESLQDMIAAEKVRVHAATERDNATFVGASIVASLPTFQDMWVTRADYNEYGSAQVTTRNCF